MDPEGREGQEENAQIIISQKIINANFFASDRVLCRAVLFV